MISAKKIANCGGINKNQGQRILNLCIVYILICNVLIFVCLSVCSNFLGGPRYNRGNVLYNSVEQWVVLSSSVKQRECFYSSVEPRECSLQLGRTAGMFFTARQNSGLFFLARQNSGSVLSSSVEQRECFLQLGRTAKMFFIARQNRANVLYSSV